jgi:hypothetical protein
MMHLFTIFCPLCIPYREFVFRIRKKQSESLSFQRRLPLPSRQCWFISQGLSILLLLSLLDQWFIFVPKHLFVSGRTKCSALPKNVECEITQTFFSVYKDNIGQVSTEVRIWTCIIKLSGSYLGQDINRNRQCSLYNMTDIVDTVCYVTPGSFKPFILLPVAAGLSAFRSWSFTSDIFPRNTWSTVNTDTPWTTYTRVAFWKGPAQVGIEYTKVNYKRVQFKP